MLCERKKFVSCLTVFETGSLYGALDGLELTPRMQARKQFRGSLIAQITADGGLYLSSDRMERKNPGYILRNNKDWLVNWRWGKTKKSIH